MILILSSPDDDHAAAVTGYLMERHGLETVLLDLSRFPVALHLQMSFGDDGLRASFGADGQRIDVSTCQVAWWRRPQPFELPDEITDPVSRRFAYTECYHAVSGLWSALDATWVNPPTRDDQASHKPYQLVVARAVGLSTPRTLITSDPASARAFAAELGPDRTVYKAFSGTEEAWRETRLLRTEELDLLDDLRFAPVIFQEFIPAVLDVRVTVVGNAVFASAVDTTGSNYAVDYRAELAAARVTAHRLPQVVEAACLALTHRLGLVYGAIDLRQTPDGSYVFLEINPSGQWLFMEERTGQPITRTFSDLLVGLLP